MKPACYSLLGLLLLLAVLLLSPACGGGGDDDATDDDAVDDDSDDDATDDDLVDDDATDDDTADDDAFGEIAFIEQTDAGMKLALVTTPLGAVTLLVDIENHLNVYPAISPDGATVAFGSNLYDPNPGVNFATMLYTIPVGGGDPQRLTTDNWQEVTETQPVFSPDGARIAYVRSDSQNEPTFVDRIWFTFADGSGEYSLYTDTEVRNDWDPDYSPDGQTLVYVSDGDVGCGDLYLADLSTPPFTRQRLTTSDPLTVESNSGPFFDATGQWIYFQSVRDDSVGLYKVAVTGGDPELVWDIGYSDAGPNAGMYAYSQFRPTPDRLSLVGSGAADGTDELFIWTTIDPLADPLAVTGANLDAVDPYWWRPAAKR